MNNKLYKLSIALLLFALPFYVVASPVMAPTTNESIFLKPYLSAWSPDNPINIDEAASSDNASSYLPLADAVLPRSKEQWFRVVIETPKQSKTDRYILTIPHVVYDEIDFYYQKEKSWEVTYTGARRPYSNRDIDDHYYSFNLILKAAEKHTIYIRVKDTGAAIISPVFNTPLGYANWIKHKTGAAYIILTILIITFLVIAVLTTIENSPWAQLAYLMLNLSGFITILFYNGYLFNLFKNTATPIESILIYMLIFPNIATLWYSYSLFNLKKNSPILARIVLTAISVEIILLLISIIDSQDIFHRIQPQISRFILLTILMISVRVIYLRLPMAKQFCATMLVYSLLLFIQIWTLVSKTIVNPLPINSSDIGMLILVCMFGYFLLRRLIDIEKTHLEYQRKAVEAEAASKAKSTFLASMSHEIRTPINGIMGMAQVLKQNAKDSAQEHQTELLLSSTNSLLHIVDDILDLSKIEAGKFKIEYSDFSIRKMLGQLSSMFENLNRNSDVKFQLDFDDKLPETISGDRARIQQILNNLLGNAFKFTEKGSVTLSCQCLASPDTKYSRLRFSVSDTGIGIDEDVTERLFEAYEQADNSTTRKYGGTGLGLTICKQLASLMNGEIGVTSTLGKGTEFWFTLDVKVAHSSDKALDQSPDITGHSSNIDKTKFDHIKILIAEDNPVNQQVIKLLLGTLGIEPIIVEDGSFAVSHYKANHSEIDIIFMDCEMPVMDGFEATQAIRSFEAQQGIPSVTICALTAHVLQDSKDRCHSVGMDDILTKPVKIEHLTELLSRLFEVLTSKK